MLVGIGSLCSLSMCLRTVSEYRKRSPQMRQCHWSRAKMYGRHSGLFGSSLGLGIFKSCKKDRSRSCAHGASQRTDAPCATNEVDGLQGFTQSPRPRARSAARIGSREKSSLGSLHIENELLTLNIAELAHFHAEGPKIRVARNI